MSIDERPQQGRTEEPGTADGPPSAAPRRHWQTALVLLIGALATAGLTVSSAHSYSDNEKKLTTLETRIAGTVLQTAQPQIEGTLGRVVGLTAAAADPVSTFEADMKTQLKPKGMFTSAALVEVSQGQVLELDHVGATSLQATNSSSFVDLYRRASESSSLLTTRVVSGDVQRLGYLLSARGPDGVYVVGASQQLPANERVTVPVGSPFSDLKFALYFGSKAVPAALLETNVSRLPLTGTTAETMVPFGNNILTLVAAPRGSLVGSWSEYLPWAILGGGILLTLGGAGLTERLVRRRIMAETLAGANQELYQQQRNVSETLQRALLPKRMPEITGFDFASRYVPATQGTEVGGDWYSVVLIDDRRFTVVVGDVSGHGIAAAGSMASLRYTIRTLAGLGFAPDEILERTSKELEQDSEDQLATAVVGLVDSDARQISLASAGHLPPLLITNGTAAFLPVAPGVPLGTPGPRPRVITVDFEPGSTLVAFTDGLIERRGEALGTGLDRLAAAARQAPTEPEDLITHLVTALAYGNQEDDIALLAIRFTGETASVGTGARGPDSGSSRRSG